MHSLKKVKLIYSTFLLGLPHDIKSIVIALCTIYLLIDHTLLVKYIKYNTIKLYSKAATDMFIAKK